MKKYERHRKNTFDIFEDYVVLGFDNSDIKFIIDKDDYYELKEFYFYVSKEPWGNYLKMWNGKKLYRYARYIMNAVGKMKVDHIDHNTQNNQKSNLRIVTNQENGFNHKLSKKNISGVCGVFWVKKRKIWHAAIKLNYKNKFLGSFENFEDAVIARLKAEKEYFGEEFSPQRHLFKEYGV